MNYNVRVYPSRLQGRLNAPPSKSAAHRALICAALAEGKSCVSPLADAEDMAATAQVLCGMGAQITRTGTAALICGGLHSGAPVTLDCMESGSTLRFLLPVAAALGIPADFCGRGRLPQRPIGILAEQLAAHGIEFSGKSLPFSIRGTLSAGKYFLPGDISSQFVSGLLFALPLLSGDSEVLITSPLESAGYVALTLAALERAGIQIEKSTQTGWLIAGNQHFSAGDYPVEGDWSNAAFWLCASALGGEVAVSGLGAHSAQGDREILEILRAFGGICSGDDGETVKVKSASLHGIRVDAAPIPDLIPIISVIAAFAQGDTEIVNAARLRAKESDRLAAVCAMLRALGGEAEEYPDHLLIHGKSLRGGVVDGRNDHRIVMAAAIAALFCEEPVTILGADAVAKSYPNFFEDLERLGGRCDVLNVG